MIFPPVFRRNLLWMARAASPVQIAGGLLLAGGATFALFLTTDRFGDAGLATLPWILLASGLASGRAAALLGTERDKKTLDHILASPYPPERWILEGIFSGAGYGFVTLLLCSPFWMLLFVDSRLALDAGDAFRLLPAVATALLLAAAASFAAVLSQPSADPSSEASARPFQLGRSNPSTQATLAAALTSLPCFFTFGLFASGWNIPPGPVDVSWGSVLHPYVALAAHAAVADPYLAVGGFPVPPFWFAIPLHLLLAGILYLHAVIAARRIRDDGARWPRLFYLFEAGFFPLLLVLFLGRDQDPRHLFAPSLLGLVLPLLPIAIAQALVRPGCRPHLARTRADYRRLHAQVLHRRAESAVPFVLLASLAQIPALTLAWHGGHLAVWQASGILFFGMLAGASEASYREVKRVLWLTPSGKWIARILGNGWLIAVFGGVGHMGSVGVESGAQGLLVVGSLIGPIAVPLLSMSQSKGFFYRPELHVTLAACFLGAVAFQGIRYLFSRAVLASRLPD